MSCFFTFLEYKSLTNVWLQIPACKCLITNAWLQTADYKYLRVNAWLQTPDYKSLADALF